MKKIIRTMLEGVEISIEVEIAPNGKAMIPIPLSNKGIAMTSNIDFPYFEKDVAELMPTSINGGKFAEECLQYLFGLVRAHNATYGRVLPADLEVYVAEYCLVVSSVAKSIGTPFPPEDDEAAFKEILVAISNMLNIPIELNIY